MMGQLLADEPALFGDEATCERLATLIEERRAALQAAAFASGQRLYAESPKALVKRIEAYWRIARAERD